MNIKLVYTNNNVNFKILGFAQKKISLYNASILIYRNFYSYKDSD